MLFSNKHYTNDNVRSQNQDACCQRLVLLQCNAVLLQWLDEVINELSAATTDDEHMLKRSFDPAIGFVCLEQECC